MLERLAIVSPEPGAPSPELRELMTYLIAVSDSQAGLGAPPPGLVYGGVYLYFDDVLRRCCILSQSEWASIAIPAELVRLSNLVAAM